MAKTRIKRPRDPIALAKLIGDIATGQQSDSVEDGKNPAAVALGKLGGKKGGRARDIKLTAQRKHEIASAAARKRWHKT
ncbi:MAG: RNA-binding protein [Alphaproteobacteria bacterium]|nr:RNA-binding protein [Alphaproteobacteria bacterium]